MEANSAGAMSTARGRWGTIATERAGQRQPRSDYTANVFRTPAAYTFHGTTLRSRGNHVPRAPTRYRSPGDLLSTIWSTLRATCSGGMPPARDRPNFASMRLRVTLYAGSSRSASGEASPIGVFTNPGSTRLTLMPNGRTSCHSDSEYPSTANLVAEQKALNGIAVLPASELMLMILPALAARIPGSTAFTMRTMPKKFVSNCALASSTLVSSAAPIIAYPALLTSTSSRPALAITCSMHARTDSSDRTSSASIVNGARFAASGLRAVPNTVNPRSASSCAVDCPMPDEAPVTRIVCDMRSPEGCASQNAMWRLIVPWGRYYLPCLAAAPHTPASTPPTTSSAHHSPAASTSTACPPLKPKPPSAASSTPGAVESPALWC